MKGTIVLALIATLGLGGCMAQRREAMQQKMEFDVVDTNKDGTVSRAEFDAWKSTLRDR